jgi:hypothetical protein
MAVRPGRAELERLLVEDNAALGRGASALARRHHGLGLLLDWLEGAQGSSWQARWVQLGEPTDWQAAAGATTKWQRLGMTAAMTSLLCHRNIQPSYPWLFGQRPIGVAHLLGEQTGPLGQLPRNVGCNPLHGIVISPEHVLAAKDRGCVRGHLEPVGDGRGRHDALDAEDLEAAGLALLSALHQNGERPVALCLGEQRSLPKRISGGAGRTNAPRPCWARRRQIWLVGLPGLEPGTSSLSSIEG